MAKDTGTKEIDLKPLLEVRQNQLGFELEASDLIDNKALGMVTANLAILIFMAQAKLNVTWWGVTFAIMPYIASVILSLYIIWPREYRGASVSLENHPEYLTISASDLIRQLLADTEEAIKVNEGFNKARMNCFISAMAVSGLATITLLFILII